MALKIKKMLVIDGSITKGHHWEPERLPKPSAGARKKGTKHPEFLVLYIAQDNF